MRPDARIFVAGANGLAGSALVRRLRAAGHANLLTPSHADLDLEDATATRRFFEHHRPEYVLDAAARVGGILANNSYPAEFIRQNLAIQTNVIHESWRAGVKRLLFLGSSCIYPRDCPQPMREDYLMTGPLEPTNRPYATAKIAGIEMCWSYNRQYQTRFLAVMPTNLYGPGDHYDLHNSHVLPALLRKMHEAKVAGSAEVEVWGTGRPLREFLYCDDMADACLFLMNLPDESFDALLDGSRRAPLVNIGSGAEVSIAELAALAAEVVGCRAKMRFDASKPDGTPRKLLDVSRLAGLGWNAPTPLRQGMQQAYQDFSRRFERHDFRRSFEGEAGVR
jgi:GDP-L-fucose synthase